MRTVYSILSIKEKRKNFKKILPEEEQPLACNCVMSVCRPCACACAFVCMCVCVCVYAWQLQLSKTLKRDPLQPHQISNPHMFCVF